jgi:hypothetical protein
MIKNQISSGFQRMASMVLAEVNEIQNQILETLPMISRALV